MNNFGALLFLVPIVELYVLLKVGGYVGALNTLGLLALAVVVGLLLLRVQGLATLKQFQETVARGQLPAAQLLDRAMLMLAGVLFIIPGFLTDLIALCLLLPPLRRFLAQMFLRRAANGGDVFMRTRSSRRSRTTLEGQYSREE